MQSHDILDKVQCVYARRLPGKQAATHILAPELQPTAHDSRQPTTAMMAHEDGLQPNRVLCPFELTDVSLSSRLSFLRSLACLFLERRASNWSAMAFSRCFSAFCLWMASINTRLFLNTLPLTYIANIAPQNAAGLHSA